MPSRINSEARVYYAETGPADLGTVLDVLGPDRYRIAFDTDEPGSRPDVYSRDQLVPLS